MKNYTATKRYLQLLLLAILMTATVPVFLFVQQTEHTAVPIFSAESGFYDEPFYLNITAPDGYEVYYSLDGSVPDRSSLRYAEPIYIGDASEAANVHSINPNLEKKYMPKTLVDKCTVIRAVAVPRLSVGVMQSEVITKSFFVGYPEGYFDDCGVISLVTEPGNLFDMKTGIYVRGETYRKYMATTSEPRKPVYNRPANYNQKGKDWEREANVTIWGPDRSLLLNKDIGIRIQGGATRVKTPKSLNLYARTEYDGVDFFETDLFGTDDRYQVLNLHAGGNASITHMNDYLMSERIQGLNYSVMSYRPYVLFLDGEYWGHYFLTESFTGDYVRTAYDLENEDIIIIKAAAVDEGVDGDLALYQKLLDFFASTDMTREENYQKACEMIDMESFLDYYATMLYIARSHDWPNVNEAMWRTRNVSDRLYADGKWRWMLFDCNGFCMTENLTEHDTLAHVLERSVIFRALWDSSLFREDFKKRILEIADQRFDAEDMHTFIECYRENMVKPLRKHWIRFYNDQEAYEEAFNSAMDSHQAFFANRRAVVESWFK